MTYRNIDSCSMLRAFGHPVATCCNMLGDVGTNLSVGRFDFSCNICGCCIMLYSFGQVRATMLRSGMRTSLIFNTQHVATRRQGGQTRAKCHTQQYNIAICCDRLAGTCKCCANDVGIYCIKVFYRNKQSQDIFYSQSIWTAENSQVYRQKLTIFSVCKARKA